MVFRRLFALALLLAVLVLALAPLHGHFTRHFWVVRTLPDHQIELAVYGSSGLEPGQVVPILRYNPEWTLPIGYATLTTVAGDRAIASWDPATFRWPMGRHATVVEERGERVVTDLGAGAGAKEGLVLHGYRGTVLVLRVRIVTVEADRSEAVVLWRGADPAEVSGLPLSEYTVRTRASPFHAPWLAWLEGGLIALVFGVWGLSWGHPGPARWWGRVAVEVRGGLATLSARPGARVVFHLLLAPLAPVVVVPLLWWSVVRVTGPLPLWGLDWARGLGLLVYLAWVAGTRTNPLLALWDALAFRPWNLGPRVLWALHLVVAMAFASTLWGFLNANLGAIRGVLARPGAPGLLDLVLIGRYTLWSLTITGCLLGYGHTVLSILWKRAPLKGLDFTPGGWFFNAICYGPLLGSALHHLLPDGVGPDPVVTSGPLYYAMLGAELWLNLLYTASIWNLGTMFGVMADKGVRTSGFYGVVRHPSYTLEPLMFCLLMLPGFSGPAQWLVALSFLGKYWLRSERDDQFMGTSNADYRAYRQQVPYKFVPGLY